MDKYININDSLDEVGLDIECIVKEIMSIILDPEKRRTDHETLSMLFVLFSEKNKKFSEYFNQYLWMKANSEYINDLEERNAYEDKRLESVKESLLGVYNVLIKHKSQSEQLLQASQNHKSFESDTIVRCSQLFSQIFAETKDDDEVIKYYPSPDEFLKGDLIKRIGYPPKTDFFATYPTVTMKNTLGIDFNSKTNEQNVSKKKQNKQERKDDKFGDIPVSKLMIHPDNQKPKIKFIKEWKWNEEKALSQFWNVDFNTPPKPDQEFICEVESPKLDQPPVERKLQYVQRIAKNADVNDYIDKFDPPETELFPDEERINVMVPGADEPVVADGDEEEANMLWHKSKYIETSKNMNIPDRDPLVMHRNYRKARLFCEVRPKAKLLQSSSIGLLKYGNNRNRYRRLLSGNFANNRYEFSNIRRPPDQNFPEMEQSWNYRKFNNPDNQFQQNM